MLRLASRSVYFARVEPADARQDARCFGSAAADEPDGGRRRISGIRSASEARLFPQHSKALQKQPVGSERHEPAAALVLGGPGQHDQWRKGEPLFDIGRGAPRDEAGGRSNDDRAAAHSRREGLEPGSASRVGVSATIDRFTKAMGEAKDRTAFPHVVVDIDKVRASGLVKDTIGLDQPDEEGRFRRPSCAMPSRRHVTSSQGGRRTALRLESPLCCQHW